MKPRLRSKVIVTIEVDYEDLDNWSTLALN